MSANELASLTKICLEGYFSTSRCIEGECMTTESLCQLTPCTELLQMVRHLNIIQINFASESLVKSRHFHSAE